MKSMTDIVHHLNQAPLDPKTGTCLSFYYHSRSPPSFHIHRLDRIMNLQPARQVLY